MTFRIFRDAGPTILNFRRLLEKHELAARILAVINGYLGDCGLSLYQTMKGNQYYPGMKVHICVDGTDLHEWRKLAADRIDQRPVLAMIVGRKGLHVELPVHQFRDRPVR